MSNTILKSISMVAKFLPDQVISALYASNAYGQFVRGMLNRVVPTGMTEITVASGELAGMKLALDLHSEKYYWLGTYEPELQKALKDFVAEGMVVFDVGANIGFFSLLFADAVGKFGHVYAFEALPENIQRLNKNLSLNNLNSRVSVFPMAIVDTSKTVHFMVGPSGGTGKVQGSGGRENISYREKIEVNGISLDQFVYLTGNPEPQVVKMDIEGGEVLALPGMQGLLKQAKPILLLELHGPQAADVCWNYLPQFNYKLHHIKKDYPFVLSKEELDWKAYVLAI